jgi:CrcB protein
MALTVGVMGGFTTYSTFSYETVRLLEEEAWLLAFANIGATTVACLLACYLGIVGARLIVGS